MNGFGVYQEGTSPLHRLDPRSKILGVLAFIVGAFLIQSLPGFILLTLASLGILAASGSSASRAVRSLKPFAWLMLFVFIFDALCVVGGDIWWQAGPIGLSSKGLNFAAESVLRFACILLATSVLMKTTTPTALTDATALLCSPLKRLGIKIDDFTLGLGMALRFIPCFSEELQRIRRAQLSRGGSLAVRNAGVAALVQAQIPTIIALFTSAFRRAETLTLAIANREYGVSADRTCFRRYRLEFKDAVAFILCMVFLCLCVLF